MPVLKDKSGALLLVSKKFCADQEKMIKTSAIMKQGSARTLSTLKCATKKTQFLC